LAASEPAFVAVKLVGSAYLVWLGAQGLLAAIRGRARSRPAAPGSLDPRTAARQGLLSNLGNPKMAAFFPSLLPQFAHSFTAVLVLHAHASQMGYLIAAELAPNLVFSLHAGAWVDRRGRRRVTMIVADLGRGALIATIPIAYLLGRLTIQQLYVVAFLSGTL